MSPPCKITEFFLFFSTSKATHGYYKIIRNTEEQKNMKNTQNSMLAETNAFDPTKYFLMHGTQIHIIAIVLYSPK